MLSECVVTVSTHTCIVISTSLPCTLVLSCLCVYMFSNYNSLSPRDIHTNNKLVTNFVVVVIRPICNHNHHLHVTCWKIHYHSYEWIDISRILQGSAEAHLDRGLCGYFCCRFLCFTSCSFCVLQKTTYLL